MANQVNCTEELLSYIRDVSLRDDPILSGLRKKTALLPAGTTMQVMAEGGQLLGLLVGLIGARTVLEVGTFTGYSTLCMARALPADGRLITCDITDRWPGMGAGFWEQAGMADRIELRIGDARETISRLLADEGPEFVDFAFIDADKANYVGYYEGVLQLLKPGGLLVIDNTLLAGQVADAADHDAGTVAVRELNALLHKDGRVEISLLPMADGISLVRKLGPSSTSS